MRASSKPARPHGSGDQGAPPSNNLWIGNLTAEVSDEVLMELFGKFEPLDVTSYGGRGYGFVFFRRTEEAVAALDALQHSELKGATIKIEFARPARACKHVWVGGISLGISREECEEEFSKIGKIEDFKFIRERNTATIEYTKLEDAIQAVRSMNDRELGGEPIRVEFLRSQPIRRELLNEGANSREYPGRGIAASDGNAGSKRPQPSQSSDIQRENQPSKILWVGYPPSVQIDEQMLHNAMILFGEIERIKSFPSRNYSFVEFRSVDEARCAKEGLQGRLFNEPRITIMYSNSGLAPDRGSEIRGGEHLQAPQGDGYRPYGGSMQVRHGSHNGYDPHSGVDFDDSESPYVPTDGKTLMGPNWRRPSPPASAVLSSPSVRTPSGWEVSDGNQFQRDPKRSRIESPRLIDNRRAGVDRGYGPIVNGRNRSRFSPEPAQDADDEFIWRGLIAKGGTPVCHARCVSVGEGPILELPEVVNCSARTGLDTLAKHYTEAIGFDLVFFLPDTEEDFGSYTEFLRYLASKDRAGVAKLDDGTTMFLVPPSDFLRKVLKVVGPERLYGVVLRLPRPAPSSEPYQAMALPQYADHSRIPQPDSLVSPSVERSAVLTDYNRVAQVESNFPRPQYNPPPSEAAAAHSASQNYPSTNIVSNPSVHSAPQNYTSTTTVSNPAASQGGISLTPELIATLATLLPKNPQTSAGEVAQQHNYRPPTEVNQPQSFRPPLPPGPPPTNYQASEHVGQSNQQQPAGQFIYPGSSVSQYQPNPSVSATVSHSLQTVLNGPQMQNSVNAYQQAPISSRPMASFSIPTQSGQFMVPAQLTQQQQVEVPNSQRGYGVVQGNDMSGLYASPAVNHNYSSTITNQVQGSAGLSQLQAVVPPGCEGTIAELPSQFQQPQAAATGAGSSVQEIDLDKNKRYQSTLQFAASLLQQIQKQPQQ